MVQSCNQMCHTPTVIVFISVCLHGIWTTPGTWSTSTHLGTWLRCRSLVTGLKDFQLNECECDQFCVSPQYCGISCFILKVCFYALLGVLITCLCPNSFHLCPIVSPPVTVYRDISLLTARSPPSFDSSLFSSVFLWVIQPLPCFVITSFASQVWIPLP